jgi:hypothetical protein
MWPIDYIPARFRRSSVGRAMLSSATKEGSPLNKKRSAILDYIYDLNYPGEVDTKPAT